MTEAKIGGLRFRGWKRSCLLHLSTSFLIDLKFSGICGAAKGTVFYCMDVLCTGYRSVPSHIPAGTLTRYYVYEIDRQGRPDEGSRNYYIDIDKRKERWTRGLALSGPGLSLLSLFLLGGSSFPA